MSNVHLVSPLVSPDVDDRRVCGGGICPVCRFCADMGIAHMCITRGGDLYRILPTGGADADQRLMDDLAAHPARPQDGAGYELRAVDRTWCTCQCGRTAGGAA